MVDQIEAGVRDIRIDGPRAREEQRCVAPPTGCGQPVGSLAMAFRDRASRSEYEITGLCQRCQDVVFAPDQDEIDAMAADTENYGRCGDCGEYRPYEFVDIGVGTIKGFDCCDPFGRQPRPPRCPNSSDDNRPCALAAGHLHGCDFPERFHRGDDL